MSRRLISADYLLPRELDQSSLDNYCAVGIPAATSSVMTVKLVSQPLPNEVVIATSAASRPVAIKTRPIRGLLLRASNVHQRSCRYTSNQALKSIGGTKGTPMSPRYPVAYRAGIFKQRQNVMARC